MFVQKKNIFTDKKAHFYRSPREDVWKIEQRRSQKYSAYLWKTFFVHMVHHHNFIVKCSAAPSRAKPQTRENYAFTWSRNTEALMQCHKQSALNQNVAFLHSKCLAECIYCKLVSVETTPLHLRSKSCLRYPWLHLLHAWDFGNGRASLKPAVHVTNQWTVSTNVENNCRGAPVTCNK